MSADVLKGCCDPSLKKPNKRHAAAFKFNQHAAALGCVDVAVGHFALADALGIRQRCQQKAGVNLSSPTKRTLNLRPNA